MPVIHSSIPVSEALPQRVLVVENSRTFTQMVAEAIVLGRRTLGIMRFNIFFALAIKAVFLVLALLGHTSLWLAVLADTGATLLVVANALRLLRPTRD